MVVTMAFDWKAQHCGKCRLPIHGGETGLRHFGFYVAHSEYRCLQLLRLEIEQRDARQLDLLDTIANLLRKSGRRRRAVSALDAGSRQT